MHHLPATLAAALMLVAVGALAAVTWHAENQLTTGMVSPPVQFSKGDNADNKRYFKSFELSSNQTSFTAEVKPPAGAGMAISDVLRLDAAGADRQVTLRATQVTNANIEAFEWAIWNATTQVAALDYLAPSPEASFTLPASETLRLDLTVTTADGAGKSNAGIDFDLQLEVEA